MSEAIIAKKAAIVDEVSEKFTAAASVVVVDYRGLTVDEVTRLRKQLRDANVEMKVIKNSILSRAAKKAGLEGLDEVFTGPTAVAFSNEDVVAPAKIMDEFAKEAKALEIKGGIIEGKVSSWKKSQHWQNCQTAKDFYLCCYLYYKRQSATWLTLSKQWQKKKMEMQLNCRIA